MRAKSRSTLSAKTTWAVRMVVADVAAAMVDAVHVEVAEAEATVAVPATTIARTVRAVTDATITVPPRTTETTATTIALPWETVVKMPMEAIAAAVEEAAKTVEAKEAMAKKPSRTVEPTTLVDMETADARPRLARTMAVSTREVRVRGTRVVVEVPVVLAQETTTEVVPTTNPEVEMTDSDEVAVVVNAEAEAPVVAVVETRLPSEWHDRISTPHMISES